MSKKRKTIVPQFGSAKKPGIAHNVPAPTNAPPPPAVNARVKPQMTSVKSGQRGQ